MREKQRAIRVVLASICLIAILGYFDGSIESDLFAHAAPGSINADEMTDVRGALSIISEATASLHQTSGDFDNGHSITVEIVAEYAFDPQKGKLEINRDSVLGHLVIDDAAGQHFLKFSKFLVLADSRTILYRGHSIADPDIQMNGKVRLDAPISFDAASKFASTVGSKLRVVDSSGSIKSSIIGKSVVAEVSTDIFPTPSEIRGKSFTIRSTANNEEFTVFATDPDAIALLTDNFEGKNEFFVTGRLAIGDGGFNAPWSWHLDPFSTTMSEFSIELCDGVPSDVENNLATWLFQVRTFCPWSSEVIAINQ